MSNSNGATGASAAVRVPSLVNSFASMGSVWQPVPRPPPNVVARPRSAYIVSDTRANRARSPAAQQQQQQQQRPSTARPTIAPRPLASPRSVPVPSAVDIAPRVANATSDSVREAVPPRRPLTAGNRVANQRSEFKREMANYVAGAAAARASNPAVGPLRYESEKAWAKLQKRTPHCPFSSTPRLGIMSPADVAAAEAAAAASSQAAAAHGGGGKQRRGAAADADGSVSPRKRPQSARCVHQPGRGHWLDGLATGSTIAGNYNRFMSQIPGVAAYDIGKASDRNRLHVTRCVFGTAGRFPGDRKVVAAASTVRDASASPRANRTSSPRAKLPPRPPA